MAKYDLIGATCNGGAVPSSSVLPSQKRVLLPWLTRGRLLGALCICLVSTSVLLLQCLHPGILHYNLLCCGSKPTVVTRENSSHRSSVPLEAHVYRLGDDVEEDQDAAYYDDTLEGAQRPAHLKHQKRRLPQCLIIGVRKGGTRALLEFLNLHPNIAAEKKEMHFFDDDVNFNRGLEYYRKRMPYSYEDQVTLEKTPAYFVEEVVPGRVNAMNDSIKLILILRDPVERAISDYMQIYTTRRERGKMHDTFENLAFDSMTGDVNKSYKAIRRSIYHRHMERWLEHFPLQQFHFVSAENLVQNPAEELRKVEDFLKLDHKLTQEHFYFNQTRGFYCMHLEHRQKCLAPSKGRAHLPIDQDVIYKLREFFRPHNQELYELVGMNFGWP